MGRGFLEAVALSCLANKKLVDEGYSCDYLLSFTSADDHFFSDCMRVSVTKIYGKLSPKNEIGSPQQSSKTLMFDIIRDKTFFLFAVWV